MLRKLALQLWLTFLAIAIAYPQSGTPVQSFGNNGSRQIDFGQAGALDDWGEAVKTDADGKIWIAGGLAGKFGIVRLNEDGKIDSTFNGNGKLQIPVGLYNYDRAYNFFFNPDHKITLIGRSDFGDLSVVRLKSDFTPDSTFSNDGKLSLPVKSGYANEEELLGAVIDHDGRILISGGSITGSYNGNKDFIILRINSDGGLDSTFAEDGQLFVPVDSSSDVAFTMATDTHNRILAAGYSITRDNKVQMSLIRIDDKGNLDSTFDGDGKKILGIGDESYANHLVIDDQGKILLAGYAAWDGAGTRKFAIVRLNDDGSYDNTFHENGIALVTVGTSNDIGYTMSLDGIGKIIVAGTSNINNNDRDYSILRLNVNGNIDSTFNNNGRLIIPIGAGNDDARSIALDDNGRILIAGWSYNGNNYDMSVARVTEDGTLDNTFNNNGKTMIPSDGSDIARSIAMDASGKIIIGGSSFNGSNYDFSYVRLNGDGSPDKTLNKTGKMIVPVGDQDDFENNLALDANGKLLLAGYSLVNFQPEFSLVRLNSNGSPDTTFNINGKLIIPIPIGVSNIIGLNIDNHGKILLAGSIDGFYGAIRLNSNGTMDSTFNGDGKKIVSDGLSGYANCVATDSNGNILLAGRAMACSGHECGWNNFQLIRLDSNGKYDSTFAGDGKLILNFDDPRIKYYIDYTTSINIDHNGNIVLAGSTSRQDNIWDNTHWGIGLTRLNADGSLDTSFKANGKPIVPLGEQRFAVTNSLTLPNSGKILFAGSIDEHFALSRLNYDGTRDSTFGDDGLKMSVMGLSYAMNADSDYIWLAGTADDDYKIVKLYGRNNQHIDFALRDTVNYGDSPIRLSAISSSGLPVSYTSSNPEIAFISSDTLYISSPGIVSVTANQAGDGSYYAAPPEIRSVTVIDILNSVPYKIDDGGISVYPNPVLNHLFLESHERIKTVIITGLEGNVIYKNTLVNDNYLALDLSEFKAGCYLITVQLDDHSPVFVRKIIKL